MVEHATRCSFPLQLPRAASSGCNRVRSCRAPACYATTRPVYQPTLGLSAGVLAAAVGCARVERRPAIPTLKRR